MRMPGFWWRIGLALAVIAASAAWLMRPLDRSVLIPVNFRGGPQPGIAFPGQTEAGYINLQGREVFNQRWGSVEEFHGETALVFRDLLSPGETVNRQGHLSASGAPRRPTSEFRSIATSHASELPRIRGYADSQGRLKFPIGWDRLPAEIDLVPVRQGQLWGYMNRSGEWVVLPQYSVAEVFDRGGIAIVARDDKYGCINSQGVEVIALRWGSLSSFEEDGQAVACVDGVCGVINRQDDIVIPVQWQPLSRTSVSGLWNAQNGLWGVIDQFGNVIVPCDYQTVSPVVDGEVQYWKGRTVHMDEQSNTINRIQLWLQWLPFSSLLFKTSIIQSEEAVYDSTGHLIWKSTWFFKSWAWVWILLASSWIAGESIRSCLRTPDAEPPRGLQDLRRLRGTD